MQCNAWEMEFMVHPQPSPSVCVYVCVCVCVCVMQRLVPLQASDLCQIFILFLVFAMPSSSKALRAFTQCNQTFGTPAASGPCACVCLCTP